jgi:hypothetical protein
MHGTFFAQSLMRASIFASLEGISCTTVKKQQRNRRMYTTMTEMAKEHHERDMVSLGMAFMGFLMGVGAICGIWFLAGLLQVLSKLMG